MPRKNKYEDVIKPNFKNIKHWISEGYSNKQIYRKLNVSEAVFYKYLSTKKEFKEIVKQGNVFLQVELEKALYKEAMGFTYVEKHAEITEVDTKKGIVTRKKQKQVTKYARANATLLMFALCNKFPEKWKRIDKEDIPDEDSEDVIDLNITDEHIKAGFEAMYSAIEKEDVKKLESKQKESVKSGDKDES